jgi:hypothetical protein
MLCICCSGTALVDKDATTVSVLAALLHDGPQIGLVMVSTLCPQHREMFDCVLRSLCADPLRPKGPTGTLQ